MSRSILLLLFAVASLRADPVACIPKAANLVVTIETPRALVEGAVTLDAWKKLQAFPQVKESLDTPGMRRFLQLLAFVETTTETKWPQLIDKVAGNGIALGAKFYDGEPKVLVVMEGTDAAVVKQVFDLFLAGAKDEATRNTAIKVAREKLHGVNAHHIGEGWFAQDGRRIFLANHKAALDAGLALHEKKSTESVTDHATFAAAKALLPPKPAAWLWFDLAAAKATPEGKDFFENTRKEIVQLLIFGSTMDAAKRSEFLAAGLYADAGGYHFTLKLPAKRSELDPVMELHVPKTGDGGKPLLEPEGVIASQSFYLDTGFFHRSRESIILDKAALKDYEQSVAEISKVLPGTTFGKILEQAGPHHRLVMAHTGEKLYGREPGQPIPPAAYVMSIRDPELNASLDGILRAGGLIAAFQTGWTMSETTHDGVKLVTYTFPEKGEPKFEDNDNLRFNAKPTFTFVNQHLIIGSTPGIVKRLIPLLKAETATIPDVWKVKAYAAGGAEVLKAHPDATVSESVLSQGISLMDARAQTLEFATWLRTLGTVELTITHGAEAYSFDATWRFGMPK